MMIKRISPTYDTNRPNPQELFGVALIVSAVVCAGTVPIAIFANATGMSEKSRFIRKQKKKI